MFMAFLLICSMCCACANRQEAQNDATKETSAVKNPNIADPTQDDTLNVLMVGNSFCYYYPDELYEIAKAAGIKVRICNVYYSGCSTKQHWTWWKNGEANYTFHENGVKLAENVNLEYCLRQGNWDAISLQTGSGDLKGDTAEEMLANCEMYITDLINLFRERFPLARMLWHSTWSNQVGTTTTGSVTVDAEDQRAKGIRKKNLALLICEKFDLERVCTGDAWQIVRDGGYDNLCARLGKGEPLHSGDNYHDGDIGGGQYLNACVWFEVLTGESCVGNSFRPEYKYGASEIYHLEESLVQTLQQAAHQAVEQAEK